MDMFPIVAHIPDSILRKMDPSNSVLVAYLKNINTLIETGVLLPKNTFPSKKQKESKKQVTGSPSKPEQVEKVVKVTPTKDINSD